MPVRCRNCFNPVEEPVKLRGHYLCKPCLRGTTSLVLPSSKEYANRVEQHEVALVKSEALEATNYKVCSKCEVSKPFNDFNNRAISRDGKQNVCKACVKEHYRLREPKIVTTQKPEYFVGTWQLVRDYCKANSLENPVNFCSPHKARGLGLKGVSVNVLLSGRGLRYYKDILQELQSRECKLKFIREW